MHRNTKTEPTQTLFLLHLNDAWLYPVALRNLKAQKKKSERVAASLDITTIIRVAGSWMRRREGDCTRTLRTGKVGKGPLTPPG
jgi:hypothetical protein